MTQPTNDAPADPAAAQAVAADYGRDRLSAYTRVAADEVDAVVRYLFGMTGDHDLAEDLAQETFQFPGLELVNPWQH